ncbi:MAG: DUF3037 domain-containing protein [Acidobacteriaceae bacterium]|nr:DUF3037 domain-containing protein [Acidobacteriaceae bacterium]
MAERLQCEFSLIRYVPDVVKGEFANIGVVLRAPGGAAQVRFTRDWGRVRCLDPDADTELLEALEAEIAARLDAGVVETVNAKPIVETLEDSLSNSVQMTAMRATLAESVPAEMEQLLRMYVEPLKAPQVRRRQSGRTLLAAEMRSTFEHAGVWRLMQKRIAAAQYTQAGDPLKLDCGYRNGKVRMFHAVSLETDVEGAKGLAYSAAQLREGVARVEGSELELTAVVERVATVSDAEQYAFGVNVMEREAIRVLTVADMARAAETARRELHV